MPRKQPGTPVRPANTTIPPRPAPSATRPTPPPPGTTAQRPVPGSATLPPRSPSYTQSRSAPPPKPPGTQARSATIPGRSLTGTPRAATAQRLTPAAPRPGAGTAARRVPAAPPAPGEGRPALTSGRPRKRGGGVFKMFAALVILGGLAFGGYRWLQHEYYAPGPATAALRIEVRQGERLRTVLSQLSDKGALEAPRAMALYLRLTGQSPHIQVGTYEIPEHASPAHILDMLEHGRVVLEQVTVIEGTTFDQFRHLLDTDPKVTHALMGKTDAEVMAALGHPGEAPEGRFFPDTYRFAAMTSDLEILSMAYDKMQRLMAQEWPKRAPNLPFTTPYQALTLASIVEKESGLASERPRIAGVFVNRLRRGMRLQTDPSVIYGLGARYDGTLHTKDLETDTPYNTYTRAGLPPTPIALPSKQSVLAALHPAQTDDLYFVAVGDGPEGGHHFSRTLADHKAAVRLYLAHLKQHEAEAAIEEQ